MTSRVLVVGRHTGDLPGVEVVGQVSPTFASDSVTEQLGAIFQQAADLQAVPLFQNVPAVALKALLAYTHYGVVVSRPGERLPETQREIYFTTHYDAKKAGEAVLLANPNAKTEIVVKDEDAILVVVVTSPMRFIFDYIDWF